MLTQSSHSESPVVVADPTGKVFKRILIVQIIAVILLAGGAISLYIAYRIAGQGLFFSFWIAIFVTVTNTFTLFTFWRQGRYTRRLDQRRQLAARGDRTQVSLAAEQPVANASALSLPTTLRIQPRYRAIFGFVGILSLATIVVPVGIVIVIGAATKHSSLATTVLIFGCIGIVVFILLLYSLIAWLLISKTRQRIEITDHELIKQIGKKVNRVPWQDARLFAIPGIAGTKQSGGPPLSYELSSAKDIIRWPSLLRGNRGVMFIGNSEIPLAEYNKQMQAILSLIVAKTNLPLYDLRSQKKYS